jgi:hypothetical protein
VDGQTVQLGRSGEAKLLDWCAHHGLVGLLSHQTVLAALAPRWEPVPGGGDHLVPVRHVHRWEAFGWSPSLDIWWRPEVRRWPPALDPVSWCQRSCMPTTGPSRWC